MDTLENEFYVTLVSNSSLNIYKKNNSFHFTNILAKELRFPPNESWRVCLSSITLANADTFIDEDKKKYLHNQSQILKKELSAINVQRNKPNPNIERLLEQLEDATNRLSHIYQHKLWEFYNRNPIFIFCDQIKPKLGTQQILSSFVLNPYDATTGNNEVIVHQPNSEEYFDISGQIIKEITISLKNPFGNLIYDSVAQPTIVVLKFCKMASNYENIYTINITNQDGQNPTDFRTKFPEALIKDGAQNPWEIAVSRVSLIPLFKSFPEGIFHLGLVYNIDPDDLLTQENWDEFFDSHRQAVFFKTYTYNQFETRETLIANLNLTFAKVCGAFGLRGSVQQNSRRFARFIISNPRHKAGKKTSTPKRKPSKNSSNTSGSASSSSRAIDEEELTNNSLNQGEEEEITNNSLNRKRRAITKWLYVIMPVELLYVLGFDGPGVIFKDNLAAVPSTFGKELKAKRAIDLHFLKPQSLLLYTNCVVPSLVGDAYGSYLTHIPVAKENDNAHITLPHTVYEPKNLEFHPLQSGNVNDIQLKLLKTNGEPPQFAIRNIQIFISLIFRLRPLSQPLPNMKTIKKYFSEK